MVIEENYRQHPAVSNSDLKLLKRPYDFYRYKILGEEQETKDVFRIGSLFDTYCFDKDSFKDKYVLCDVEAPSNAYHVEYVENRIAGMDPVVAYKNSKYKTDNKTDDQISKKAAELEEEYKDYIEFYANVGDRTIYTEQDSYAINAMASSIMSHKLSAEYIFADSSLDDASKSSKKGKDFFTHLRLTGEINGVQLKGELDRLMIDHDNKAIHIIDLKTTSQPIYNFGWSARKFDYYMQLFIYTELALKYLEELYKDDSSFSILDWKVHQCFVAVESVAPYECRVFRIPKLVNFDCGARLTKMLEAYKWHVKKDIWNQTYESYINGGYHDIDYMPSNEFKETYENNKIVSIVDDVISNSRNN